MNRKLKIFLSSYLDGECNNPEIVGDMLKKNKKAKEIYTELLLSQKIKDLEYTECPVAFDKIVIAIKREPILQLLVTVGTVAIAILFLLPIIKNSYQNQQSKIKDLTEILK